MFIISWQNNRGLLCNECVSSDPPNLASDQIECCVTFSVIVHALKAEHKRNVILRSCQEITICKTTLYVKITVVIGPLQLGYHGA